MKDTVDFGSQVFRIEIIEKLFLEAGPGSQKMQGLIDPKRCLIQIEKDLDSQSQMLTLWHELVHQLLNRGGLDGEEFINPKMEEAVVEGLSEGVMLLLRLNPWLGDIE